jgi:hypothetical protein
MRVSADYCMQSVIFRAQGDISRTGLTEALLQVPGVTLAETVDVLGHPGWVNIRVAADSWDVRLGEMGTAAWGVMRKFAPDASLESAPWL